ncbi:MAG: cytochrome c [Rhodospirillales bacterium]|nr:cytochrome c [Rhodospirillales bacterium]
MNRINFVLAAAVVGAGAMLAVSAASAHGGATGVVKERMDQMKAMGESMKTLSRMLQGQAPYDAASVRREAGAIAARGGAALTDLFPEDTGDPPSEALPSIWREPQRFRRLADDLVAYAEALSAAADNPRPGPMASAPADMAAMMGGGGPQAMMGGAPGAMIGGDPAALATMPPQAAFQRLTDTCGACHDRYRAEKD